jgi:hypothetical protein
MNGNTMDARDEARLNDWIEGVADAADRAAVEAMFAADPALAARTDAMRRDRARLTGLGSSAVPADVRAAIDDRVARMLLLAEPELGAAGSEGMAGGGDTMSGSTLTTDVMPGFDTADWRARRDRRRTVRRWSIGAGAGLAAAASITLLVVLGPGRTPTGSGAGNDPAGPATDGRLARAGDGDGISAPPVAEPFRPSADAFVVHGAPLPSDAPPMLAAATSPSPATTPPTNGASPSAATPVPAIVLSGFESASLESVLVALVAEDATADSAVVAVTRNLTTDALARLLPRGGGGPSSEPLWADLERARGGAADGGWRGRVDQRLDRVVSDRRAAGDASVMGVVIAGDADRRPGWGEQIVFAESGAGWTLSVRADRVAEALARLAAVGGADSSTTLVALDPVRWDLEAGSDSWRAVREALRRAAAEDPARIMHIPIVRGDG